MSAQRAALVQVVLEGVPLPATKETLVAYACREDETAARELQSLPDREYHSLDEVGEALASVQPASPGADAVRAREESGDPPGAGAYVEANAEPGWVRPDGPHVKPPQKTLDEQSQTLKKQQERQEKPR